MATSSDNGHHNETRTPSRPSAKVFRRRRQVAVALVLIVVGALIFGGVKIAGFIGGLGTDLTADVGSSPTASASSSLAAKTAVAKAEAPKVTRAVCDESGIKVTASADQESYSSGTEPKLTLRVSNTGGVACSINVGTSQMQFKITSGNDVVFNSKDCQVDATNLAKTLNPGASETANFTWKRNRSIPGCTKDNTIPGDGTYVYVATLGKWSSEGIVFTLK